MYVFHIYYCFDYNISICIITECGCLLIKMMYVLCMYCVYVLGMYYVCMIYIPSFVDSHNYL